MYPIMIHIVVYMAYLFIDLKLLYQYEIDVGWIPRTDVAQPRARQK